MRLTAVVCKWITIKNFKFMDIMQKNLKRLNSCDENLHKQNNILSCLLFSSFFSEQTLWFVNVFYQSIFMEKVTLSLNVTVYWRGKWALLQTMHWYNSNLTDGTNRNLHANRRKPSGITIRKSDVSPPLSPSIVAEVSIDDDKIHA